MNQVKLADNVNPLELRRARNPVPEHKVLLREGLQGSEAYPIDGVVEFLLSPTPLFVVHIHVERHNIADRDKDEIVANHWFRPWIGHHTYFMIRTKVGAGFLDIAQNLIACFASMRRYLVCLETATYAQTEKSD